MGLTGHSASKQRFARPWRSNKQHALRDPRTSLFVFIWTLKEMHNFLQLKFGFVASRHIESHASVAIRHKPGPTLPDRKDDWLAPPIRRISRFQITTIRAIGRTQDRRN